jgi:hypothetical protein
VDEITIRVNAMISQSDNLMRMYGDNQYFDESLCRIIEALNCRIEALIDGTIEYWA